MRLEMFTAAENLEFEKAARLRDELKKQLEGAACGGRRRQREGAIATEVAAFEPYAAKRKAKRGAACAKGKKRGRGMGAAKTGKVAARGRKWKS